MKIEQLEVTAENLMEVMADKDVYVARIFMDGMKIGKPGGYPPMPNYRQIDYCGHHDIYPIFKSIGKMEVKDVLCAIDDEGSVFFKISEYPVPMKPGDINEPEGPGEYDPDKDEEPWNSELDDEVVDTIETEEFDDYLT